MKVIFSLSASVKTLTVFFLLICPDIYGQYIKNDSSIDTTYIIEKLNKSKANPEKFKQTQNEIFLELKKYYALNKSKLSDEQKANLIFGSENVALLNGFAKEFNPNFIKDKLKSTSPVVDTLESEIDKIIKKLDSIETLKDSLIESLKIVSLSSDYTRATKEHTVKYLASIPSIDVTDFLFKNHETLKYFNAKRFENQEELTNFIENVPAAMNTGLNALINNYSTLVQSTKDKIDERYWWLLVPSIIDRFDEMDAKSLRPTASHFFLEYFFIRTPLKSYKKYWLMIEFISANMDNQDSAIVKRLEKFLEDKNYKQ